MEDKDIDKVAEKLSKEDLQKEIDSALEGLDDKKIEDYLTQSAPTESATKVIQAVSALELKDSKYLSADWESSKKDLQGKANLQSLRSVDFEKVDEQLVESINEHLKDLKPEQIETADPASASLLKWVKKVVSTKLFYGE